MGPSWGPSWGHVGAGPAKKLFFWVSGGHSEMAMDMGSSREPLGSDFGAIPGPKMEPKSVQNRFQEGSSTKCKNDEKHWFSTFLGGSGGRRSSKNRFRNDLKLGCQENTQKLSKKSPTWPQVGPGLGPSWGSESSWSRPGDPQTDPRNRHRKPHSFFWMFAPRSGPGYQPPNVPTATRTYNLGSGLHVGSEMSW